MLSGEPGRQQHHLGRQRRNVVPRPQPEQRQPDVREHARGSRAAARRAIHSAARAHVRGSADRRRPGAAPSRPRSSSTGRRARRGSSPRCRPRAAGSGSTRPSARSPLVGARCPGTRAAAGPRRPSSRSSRARPATSRPSPAATAGARALESSASSVPWLVPGPGRRVRRWTQATAARPGKRLSLDPSTLLLPSSTSPRATRREFNTTGVTPPVRRYDSHNGTRFGGGTHSAQRRSAQS